MTQLSKITTKKISDSRGSQTIAVEIEANNQSASASVPQGKSTGKFEVVNIDAELAEESIRNTIAPSIIGKEFASQREFDEHLIALDKTKNLSQIGGNSTLALSICFARLQAKEKSMPLWKSISHEFSTNPAFPKLYANIIGGGLHSSGGPDIQEYLAITKTNNPMDARKQIEKLYEEVLKSTESGKTNDEGAIEVNAPERVLPFKILSDALASAYIKEEFTLGMDAAADNIEDKETLPSFYSDVISRFEISYIEDPYPEDEIECFSELKKDTDGILICGDDLTVTNPEKIYDATSQDAINAVIIKPNQIGTVFMTMEAIKAARENNMSVIVSHRSGETDDSFISDLAYAVGAEGMKLGAPVQKERISKYERLEDILGETK